MVRAAAPAPTDDGADDEVADATEPAWRQRAIDRSTQTARQRASKRVQRFLTSAREIIAEKDSTEFTVQEVVDRSKQSLRSFYQYFEGKHELLLSLFEEEMDEAITRLKAATTEGATLERIEHALTMLYDLCAPGRTSVQPLFSEFAQRLTVDHPDEVSRAYRPLVELVVELVEQAGAEGLLRPGKPRRLAVIAVQTATITAGRTGIGGRQAISSAEIWDFCLHSLVPDEVAAEYRRSRSGRRR